MNTDVPLMVGSVNDLVDGSLEVGYTVPHALASDRSIFGEAVLFDLPFQEVQLKVESLEGSSQVRVTVLDVHTAKEESRQSFYSLEIGDLDRKVAAQIVEEVIEYAYRLAENGSTIIDVIN